MYKHDKVEKEVERFWEENKIYEKVKEAEKGRDKKFFFVDGPPYVTGEIHPGTGWNKSMKDAFLRFYRLRGYRVRDQPGFDTHGLPIEVKVEKLLNIKNKGEIEDKVGLEKFIKECKAFADKYIGIMTNQFKSLGVWMDWDNPYVTYKNEYIERSWETLKKAEEKGLLEEGYYVIPYCYRCETTLANYELEYKDAKDPSIYVKFKVKGEEDTYLIIWTTTPWTLVGNMGVMVHPDFEYAEVEVEGERWILAKDLVEPIMDKIGKSYAIVRTFKGKELEGLRYEHPFQDVIAKEYDRRVVLSEEYVTLEEGTGLVHTAPGHGPEDYIVGKRYGLEIFSPVDEKGNYTEEAGELAGKNVREANEEIINILDKKGALIHRETIVHRYPHCWRCKTPLIFRTTKQWFIKISKMKDEMLKEIEKTKFSPKFAKDRFKQFVEQAPDWCISRQRYWGIPLPIWKCKNGHVKVIGSVKELEELSHKKLEDLHRPYIDEVKFKCPVCGEEMERVKDVLDVWFDSGNAVWASLTPEEEKEWGNQADLIFEGQDQIRGWFYSLLGSGVVRQDKNSYKAVLMHGFFVDEKGEKMSKSVGNFIPVEEILKKYGADAFRLWGASNTTWEEIKFSWEELRIAYKELNILHNLISYLERIDAKPGSAKLEEEDKWIIAKTKDVLAKFNRAFAELRPFEGVKALRKLLVEEISQFYMKRAKQRIAEGKGEGAKYALYIVMLDVLKMFAVITPYSAEYLYQKFYRKDLEKESIYMLTLSDGEEMEKDEMDKVKAVISAALKIRNEAKIKLRWPLRELVVSDKGLKKYEGIIRGLVNVKEVKFGEAEGKSYVMEEVDGVKVWLNVERDEELEREALLNEVIRRIQAMRKELRLVEKDKIAVRYEGLDDVFESYAKRIAERVNAVDIKKGAKRGKEWDIEGHKVKIEIEKVE